MRYYVLCLSQIPGIVPFICGEVAFEDPDADRQDSLAGVMAGSRSMILTRDELDAEPEGRDALVAWDSDDDTEFDRETAALADGDDVGPPKLTLVGGTISRDVR